MATNVGGQMDLAKLCRDATATKHPADAAPVIRARAERPELVCLRWGLQPHQGHEPVINLRSEGRRLDKNRCLVPATDFFLFTGIEHPKTKWRVTVKDCDWFCFGGIWQDASADWPESYAVLTIDAAPDLARLTERQMAVILPEHAPRWLGRETAPAELLKPLPRGSYQVEQC